MRIKKLSAGAKLRRKIVVIKTGGDRRSNCIKGQERKGQRVKKEKFVLLPGTSFKVFLTCLNFNVV